LQDILVISEVLLGLQDDFDIEEEQQLKSKELELIEHDQSNVT
jgi:hypothetical protein